MNHPSLLRRASLLSFLIICSVLSFAQVTLKGRIISGEDQKPVAGATVSVKGSNKITSTDQNGDFSINADIGAVLIVTSVGFASREVKASSDLSNLILATDARNLNEVVVTALGIKKRTKRLGYAVQEVKGEDLTKARDANPISGLIGKVAGLSVGPSAEMLRKPLVLLRGNEITLYVVDGIPISSDTWNISPDDIESYTVLKGPQRCGSIWQPCTERGYINKYQKR